MDKGFKMSARRGRSGAWKGVGGVFGVFDAITDVFTNEVRGNGMRSISADLAMQGATFGFVDGDFGRCDDFCGG